MTAESKRGRRNAIPVKDQNILWARAGGRCSMPDCPNSCLIRELVDQAANATDRIFHIGQMCHIVGERPTSARWHYPLPQARRNRYENLILLCPTHHALIDNPQQQHLYTVEHLKNVKAAHESRVIALKESDRINLLPYPQDRYFRGRADEMDGISRCLRASGSALINQPAVVQGEGGIGKTRLAIEYAWRFQYHYSALLWIDCDSPENLRSNLAGFYHHLIRTPNTDERIQEKQIQIVLRWLKTYGGWLLICDNVDSDASIATLYDTLPPLLNGHVLITSRRAHWPRHITTIPLPVLTPAEAEDFMHSRAKAQSHETRYARKVAKYLGYFPLALEQAAAWVLWRRRSWREYCVRFRESPMHLLAEKDPVQRDYKETVATTWRINVQELSAGARAMLTICASFAPEPIPRTLFANNHAGRSVISKEDEVDRLLLECEKYSLIRMSSEYVRMHRLVQLVIREALTPNERKDNRFRTLRYILQNAPSSGEEVKYWALWSTLAPHIDYLWRREWEQIWITEGAAEFLISYGAFHRANGNYARAEQVFAKCIRIASKTRMDDVRLKALSELGGTLWTDGRSRINRPGVSGKEREKGERLIKRSERHFREVLQARESTANSAEQARDCNNLANALRDLRRFNEAEKLYRRAIDAELAASGARTAQMAIRLNNLSIALGDQGKFQEAQRLVLDALSITRDSLGRESEPMVVRYFNVWSIYKKMGREKSARAYLKKSVDLARRILPPNHPNRVRAEETFENARTMGRH